MISMERQPAALTASQRKICQPHCLAYCRKLLYLFAAEQAGINRNRSRQLFFLQHALRADPSDGPLAYRIARILRNRGKIKKALHILRSTSNGSNTPNLYQRFIIENDMQAGQYKKALIETLALIRTGTQLDRHWAKSKQLRIGLELRAQANGYPENDRVNLWWMQTPYPGNFGDILNPYVIENLTGVPPKFSPKGKGILAIGSIAKFASKATSVWGSGTQRMTDTLDSRAVYRAVRGPLTREAVLKYGGHCPPVFGDPAVFLPMIYNPGKITKKYPIGLICHYTHAHELRSSNEVKNISILRESYEDIEKFIDELHECELIISTSLHGLIVSHAYGIPARWGRIANTNNSTMPDTTKFMDYLLSVGLDSDPAITLNKHDEVNPLLARERFHLPKKIIDMRALAEVAPFRLKDRFWINLDK